MIRLLKPLLNHTLYEKYGGFVKPLLKENKELTILFELLSRLHEKYHRDIELTEYSLFVLFNCLEKDKETLSHLLNELQSVEDASDIIEDLIEDARNKQNAYQLALVALEASEGRKSFTDLLTLTKSFNVTESVSDAFSDRFVTDDLTALYTSGQQKPGLRWRTHALNRSLGSLRQGDFGFLFARPETGKTTLLASEGSFMAEQLHKEQMENHDYYVGPVVLFNNEEQGSKVQIKFYQAALGMTLTELFADLAGNRQAYLNIVGDKLKIYDSAAIHKRQVEQICEELKPRLIIFDQLDKIKGFSGDQRDDLRLGEIYIWARELAKSYCPVIGVSQSDATGEGKRWLTMDNVAGAKTAKQAEADWILGVGRTHDTVDEFTRFFCLSKNKLIGDLDTDPTLRHGKMAVAIQPELGRYRDIE
jgi:hypothetical protein